MSLSGDMTGNLEVTGGTRAHLVRGQIALKSPDPAVREACRRTLARAGHGGPSSLAVTSASSHEDRERVAHGLALIASAELGMKTIFINLDLRIGGSYNGKADRSEPGIFELLQEQISIEDYLSPIGPKLELAALPPFPVTARSPVPIDWSIDAIEQLRERCDLLIATLPALDSGPVAAYLSRLFTRVVLVVLTGSVSHQHLQSTVLDLPEPPLVIFDATRKPRLIRRILGHR
jgi:Mrp family chromosome partitioning ATPase